MRMNYRFSDLLPRMQRYRMGVVLLLVLVAGLAAGVLLPDLQWLWVTLMLVLAMVLLVSWTMVHRG